MINKDKKNVFLLYKLLEQNDLEPPKEINGNFRQNSSMSFR